MKTLTPNVSIVMPAYNAERFIAEAIRSVLSQSYSNLELIVVDDGSSDQTTQIAEKFADQDPRVKLILQENSGRPGVARNRGIAEAKGGYLTFLDSDDYWLPDRLAIMIDALEAHPDWVAAFHDLKLVDIHGGDLNEIYLRDASFLLKAAPWLSSIGDDWQECNQKFYVFMSLFFAAAHTQSIVIARHRMSEPIQFNPDFIICEDTDLWIRIALLGRMGYLDKVLSAYRQHGTSIIRNRIRFASESLKFHEHNLGRLGNSLTSSEMQQYIIKIANYQRELGYQYYRNCSTTAARKMYLAAFQSNPKLSDIYALMKSLLPSRMLQKFWQHH